MGISRTIFYGHTRTIPIKYDEDKNLSDEELGMKYVGPLPPTPIWITLVTTAIWLTVIGLFIWCVADSHKKGHPGSPPTYNPEKEK